MKIGELAQELGLDKAEISGQRVDTMWEVNPYVTDRIAEYFASDIFDDDDEIPNELAEQVIADWDK